MGRIITAADKRYFPGVIALYNSCRCFAEEYKFTCLVEDEYSDEYLNDLGIDTVLLKRSDIPHPLPKSRYWVTETLNMYSRLLIPSLFEEEELIWIDADAIVIKQLPKVDLTGYSCAGVIGSSHTIGEQVLGICVERIEKTPAIQAGVLLFNREEWIKQEVTKRCFELMHYNYEYLYVVQSVLSLALMGNFKSIPFYWNFFASEQPVDNNVIIAHWAGGIDCLPWVNKNLPNIKLWEEYYNDGVII